IQWKLVLLGNFEQAIMNTPPDLGPSAVAANQSIIWSQRQVHSPVPNEQAAERRWSFLQRLPRRSQEGELLFVHGSARDPLYEYVFPEDVYNQQKMERLFAQVERYCFQGHTHIPGIFTEDLRFHSPEELDGLYPLDGRKTLCNVGSVGQPRDSDWRACYV